MRPTPRSCAYLCRYTQEAKINLWKTLLPSPEPQARAEIVIAVITVVTAFVVQAGRLAAGEAGNSSDMQDHGMAGWYRPKRGRVYAFVGTVPVPNR